MQINNRSNVSFGLKLTLGDTIKGRLNDYTVYQRGFFLDLGKKVKKIMPKDQSVVLDHFEVKYTVHDNGTDITRDGNQFKLTTGHEANPTVLPVEGVSFDPVSFTQQSDKDSLMKRVLDTIKPLLSRHKANEKANKALKDAGLLG